MLTGEKFLKCKVVSCTSRDKPFIFVSYSHSDASYVFPVLESLAAAGYNIWYGNGTETKWSDELADAIVKSDAVVVFASTNAMASNNVRTEIEFAFSKNVKVIPVCLEDTDILSPSLLSKVRASQGVVSNDTNVIVSKLSAWLTRSAAQENWLPVKSSAPADKPLPVKSRPLQEAQNFSQEDQEHYARFGIYLHKGTFNNKLFNLKKKRPDGLSIAASRPFLAKLLFIIFFVNVTEILSAYFQWGFFQRPFVVALFTYGLASVVFYYYFFCRDTYQESFLDHLLPSAEAIKSVLYGSFVLGWLISSLDFEQFKAWTLLIYRVAAAAHYYMYNLPLIGWILGAIRHSMDNVNTSEALPQIPATIKSIATFASAVSGALLIFYAVLTGTKANNT